jgi:hypothetical protein
VIASWTLQAGETLLFWVHNHIWFASAVTCSWVINRVESSIANRFVDAFCLGIDDDIGFAGAYLSCSVEDWVIASLAHCVLETFYLWCDVWLTAAGLICSVPNCVVSVFASELLETFDFW